ERLLGTGAPRIESIAVLPLENLSRDPEQEYFADGMTEALISDLAQISALRVISRTSVMQYKGVRRPLPEIARELNVDAVVEGSGQRVGDRVKITAQLIHAPTDKHLWAESYERDLRDVLTLQSEVARAITDEIKVKLTPQEQTRLAGAPAINPEAHELYLRGRYAWNKRTPAGMTKSIEYFNQALEHDPTNALIWAGLADSYNQLGYRGYLSPREAYPRAKAAAAKSLEINPTLAEAHAALGFALLNHDWDWPAAERALRRALELNPNYAEAHHWYSHYLMDTGRVRESLEESKRALEVDPLSMIISVHLGWHYISARQYDLAVEHLKKTVADDPSYYSAHFHLGRAYQFRGAFADAIAEQRKAAALSNNSTEALTALATALALGGQRDEAARILDQLKQMASTQYVSSCDIASVYAALGATSQSFEWLERARQERASRLIELKADPLFDPLRGEPRFRELLRRMNFPQ
ncbi:MAG: tetratricopeptide repeat protein, partial [Acidobacteria bacterium]|nr:tetratricopeptide repeat protein [Acidobacteriota bacterium]